MYYIETDETKKVVFRHNFPNELTAAEKQDGYLIDYEPMEPETNGLANELYYDKTKGYWYEYSVKPLTTEERMNTLEKENEKLKAMVADLGLQIGGGL